MVAIPVRPSSSNAPDPNYNIDKFMCNPETNSCTSPQGHKLNLGCLEYLKIA